MGEQHVPAQGVLIGRPVMWGLSAYGDAGVQGVIEMAQTELARFMGMCGKSNLNALGRDLVKVHAPLPAKTATTNATQATDQPANRAGTASDAELRAMIDLMFRCQIAGRAMRRSACIPGSRMRDQPRVCS